MLWLCLMNIKILITETTFLFACMASATWLQNTQKRQLLWNPQSQHRLLPYRLNYRFRPAGSMLPYCDFRAERLSLQLHDKFLAFNLLIVPYYLPHYQFRVFFWKTRVWMFANFLQMRLYVSFSNKKKKMPVSYSCLYSFKKKISFCVNLIDVVVEI